jgi:hypothetical protein
LHAFVGEIIVPPIDSPLNQATLCFGNLTDHFNRLQTRLYEFAIRHDRLPAGVPVAVHHIPENGGGFDG